MTNRGTSLLLDTTMFICFAALLSWRLTGVAAHEWLGLALIALILVHLIVHWGWVEAQVANAVRSWRRRRLTPFLLNAALFVAMGITLVSGIAISKVAFPNGLSPEVYLRWHGIHETATTFTVLILGLHVALNWDHIRGGIRRALDRSRRPATAAPRWWQAPPGMVLRRLGWIAAVSGVFSVAVWGGARLLPATTAVTMVFADGHMERRAPPAEITRLSPQGDRPAPSRGAARFLMSLALLSAVAVGGRRALRPRATR
ncbi:MAG TPA: DUF4405 domain-containing protein [Gemmatimonadales bacterium]|nr:DUF4405 domain-containing protein [Gemmatimonadales bacterium]